MNRKSYRGYERFVHDADRDGVVIENSRPAAIGRLTDASCTDGLQHHTAAVARSFVLVVGWSVDVRCYPECAVAAREV